MLLNPRDRAYTVTELHALLARAGLRIEAWMEPARYDPDWMLPDPRLRARAATLPPIERAALAEALAGNMAVHTVYCVRAGDPPHARDPLSGDAVPVCRGGNEELLKGLQPDGSITFRFDGLRLPVPLPALAPSIIRLIDGARSVADIRAAIVQRGGSAEAFDRAWPALFQSLERLNRILLAALAG